MFKFHKHIALLLMLFILILVTVILGIYVTYADIPIPPTEKTKVVLNPYDKAILSQSQSNSQRSSAPPVPPPVAYFSTSPETAYAKSDVSFDASISYDSFGQLISYEWDFGDKSTGEGKNIAHSYSSPGIYEVTLTVKASSGLTKFFSKKVSVSQENKDAVSPLETKSTDLYTPDDLLATSQSIDEKNMSWDIAPENNALLQNFPNPFNPETWIPYRLKEGSTVSINIYNSAGNLVRQLDLGYMPPGFYISKDKAAYWDGRNSSGEPVSSGTYFYTIQAGEFIAIRKLIASI